MTTRSEVAARHVVTMTQNEVLFMAKCVCGWHSAVYLQDALTLYRRVAGHRGGSISRKKRNANS